jgi:nucleotide-binding universal stress UspA family protein
MSFNRILLCYDTTREGRRALRYGADLAQQLGAQTHLLAVRDNAYLTVGYDVLVAQAAEAEEQLAKDILHEGVERLKARGVSATGYFAIGNPLDQIPHFAERLKADLIVVGHKPCGVLARWWNGPGNGLLLDRVKCSVLVAIAPVDDPADVLAEAAADEPAQEPVR